jgi:hypothetical protein
MTNFQAIEVTKTYNGKIGCMCGCQGKYSEPGTLASRLRLNRILNFIGPMRPDADNFGDKASYSTETFMGDHYVYVEENGRNTTVYFKG